jgi:hypothetical protein
MNMNKTLFVFIRVYSRLYSFPAYSSSISA